MYALFAMGAAPGRSHPFSPMGKSLVAVSSMLHSLLGCTPASLRVHTSLRAVNSRCSRTSESDHFLFSPAVWRHLRSIWRKNRLQSRGPKWYVQPRASKRWLKAKRNTEEPQEMPSLMRCPRSTSSVTWAGPNTAGLTCAWPGRNHFRGVWMCTWKSSGARRFA